MLIERAAYASGWRNLAPSAKALFAAAGMVSGWIARHPVPLTAIAISLALVTLLLARVPARIYVSALAPPSGFLAVSCLTMLTTVDGSGLHWAPAALPTVVATAMRAQVMLAALLGLVLTTPLPDLLGLCRRVRVPTLLLDLMVLCYRMLFVLSQAWAEGVVAQTARMGYHRLGPAWRSVGLLAGQMALQVWHRAGAMQAAALARGYDGRLRFLPCSHPRERHHLALALFAGLLLILIALIGDRW